MNRKYMEVYIEIVKMENRSFQKWCEISHFFCSNRQNKRVRLSSSYILNTNFDWEFWETHYKSSIIVKFLKTLKQNQSRQCGLFCLLIQFWLSSALWDFLHFHFHGCCDKAQNIYTEDGSHFCLPEMRCVAKDCANARTKNRTAGSEMSYWRVLDLSLPSISFSWNFSSHNEQRRGIWERSSCTDCACLFVGVSSKFTPLSLFHFSNLHTNRAMKWNVCSIFYVYTVHLYWIELILLIMCTCC